MCLRAMLSCHGDIPRWVGDMTHWHGDMSSQCRAMPGCHGDMPSCPQCPTLEARFSTSATMEFLKSVPVVSGRLVTSVMLCSPSGHMARRTGSALGTVLPWGWRHRVPCSHPMAVPPTPQLCPPCPQPVVEEPLEVLEERVLVLVQETLHRVPEGEGHHTGGLLQPPWGVREGRLGSTSSLGAPSPMQR